MRCARPTCARPARCCRCRSASLPAQSAHRSPPARRRASSPARRCPPGADAIVMQEHCEAVSDDAVRINAVPQAGQWIRRRGEDVCAGATVLTRGARLTPQAQGLAATVGAATLDVLRRPRVALFSTGDELVMPGSVAPQPAAGRDLQLQPLHAARPAASRRLRGHRPWHRARPPRRDARGLARPPQATT